MIGAPPNKTVVKEFEECIRSLVVYIAIESDGLHSKNAARFLALKLDLNIGFWFLAHADEVY